MWPVHNDVEAACEKYHCACLEGCGTVGGLCSSIPGLARWVQKRGKAGEDRRSRWGDARLDLRWQRRGERRGRW